MYLSSILSWCSFLTTFVLCARFFPSTLEEEKLNGETRYINYKEYRDIMTISSFNIITFLPVGLIFETILPVIWIPPWYFRIPIAIILFDILYYILHYSFHNFKALKKYHDMHHEYNLAHPVTTFYSSVLENIVINMGSAGITPFILGFTGLEMVIWFTGVCAYVCTLHSQLITSESYHMIHHFKRYCNYGLFGITDIVCRTFYTKIQFDYELDRLRCSALSSNAYARVISTYGNINNYLQECISSQM